MSNNYPFHRVGANLPGYKKPAVIVPTNYYGCDPYNTVDASAMRQRVLWSQIPTRAFRTWTQVRYGK